VVKVKASYKDLRGIFNELGVVYKSKNIVDKDKTIIFDLTGDDVVLYAFATGASARRVVDKGVLEVIKEGIYNPSYFQVPLVALDNFLNVFSNGRGIPLDIEIEVESEHDLFTIGHTSTSLSLASGILHARDLKKEKGNVVAIIGDGSLSGGMAYEGLNTIATLGTNAIIIINDNDQSIAKNPKGGIYTALRELRENKGQVTNNIFKALGYDYNYLEDGNNLEELISLFKEVKDIDHPVVLHIYTEKGKGFEPAEKDHKKFHAGGPFSLETGEYKNQGASSQTYNGITSQYLVKKLEEDPLAVVVNAGTPRIVFDREIREKFRNQFVDVSIAEQQAATMTTGLAKNGAKPIWSVFSTFLQRAYDQLSHDMALNNQAGVVLVYGASIKSMNDESHLGFFDIPFISHIPNFVYLAPTNKEEHLAMLDWAINQNNHPVAIRVPVGSVVETGEEDTTDYSILNKNKVVKAGKQVAIFGVGNFYGLAEKVVEQLKSKHNIEATLVNPKFIRLRLVCVILFKI